MHTFQPSKIRSSYLQRTAEMYSFSCAISHVTSCYLLHVNKVCRKRNQNTSQAIWSKVHWCITAAAGLLLHVVDLLLISVADPGFSEWEGMLFCQMRGMLAISDQNCHEIEKIYTKMGGVLHTLLTRFHIKNTETNIVFNDNYILINCIENERHLIQVYNWHTSIRVKHNSWILCVCLQMDL